MQLKMIKMSCGGDDSSWIYVSIKAQYGWQGEERTGTVKLTYNGLKKDLYLTVKAASPGISLVLERIIDIINGIESQDAASNGHFKSIIELLQEKLKLEYDSELVQSVLTEHQDNISQ